MTSSEYVDFDNLLFTEIEIGNSLEMIAANQNSRLKEIAHEHRINNPWRNHQKFADLVHKRLRTLCKEGRIYHDGEKWRACPA